jgi:4a-hydroxytetrahydrobiopterin dehydratase
MNKPNILTEEEIREALKGLPGWKYEAEKIIKEFKFIDFMDGFGFISQLAPYFEEKDHHPDMHIFYNRILFELQRFDIGGKVTDRDIEVAKEIEQRFTNR